MIKYPLLVFALLFLSACSDDQLESSERFRVEDIGSVKLLVEKSFTYVERQGIDSYVAFLINNDDTFYIEFGDPKIIYGLFDLPPMVLSLQEKEKYLSENPNTPPDEVTFSNFPEEDRLQNIFQENFYQYDTINEIVVKIVQPKRIGQGVTGLYAPALRNDNALSIYARNLDSAAHRNAIKMFRSISYK